MNNRIQELKLEAAVWAKQNHQAADPENLTKQEYEQIVLLMTDKFAELIIQECAEFVRYKAEKSMSQEILYVGNDLLTHFGIE